MSLLEIFKTCNHVSDIPVPIVKIISKYHGKIMTGTWKSTVCCLQKNIHSLFCQDRVLYMANETYITRFDTRTKKSEKLDILENFDDYVFTASICKNDLVFSNRGVLKFASNNKEIRVGKLIKSIACNPDSFLVYLLVKETTDLENDSLIIVNFQTGNFVKVLKNKFPSSTQVIFDPWTKSVCVAETSKISIFDENGNTKTTMCRGGNILSIASNNGQLFIQDSYTKTNKIIGSWIHVVDIESGTKLYTFDLKSGLDRPHEICIQDGQLFVFYFGSKTVEMFE